MPLILNINFGDKTNEKQTEPKNITPIKQVDKQKELKKLTQVNTKQVEKQNELKKVNPVTVKQVENYNKPKEIEKKSFIKVSCHKNTANMGKELHVNNKSKGDLDILNKTEKVNNYIIKSMNKRDKEFLRKLDGNTEGLDALLDASGAKYEPIFAKNGAETFSKLNPYMKEVLEKQFGITKATAIQEKALPALSQGRDVLIKSATGSGKTLSFAIPMITDLERVEPPINRSSGIFALVISPTRELSQQTYEVFNKLTSYCVRIVPGQIIAGIKGKNEKRSLRKGLNVVVATPNRLWYHMESSRNINYDKLRWLIIDEADRLAEMGFGENVSRILNKIRSNCTNKIQTVLVSATLTPRVEKMADLALVDPVYAMVDDSQAGLTEEFALPESLQHYVLECDTKIRMVMLLSFVLLKCRYNKDSGKVVVFMATQDLVQFHYQLFKDFFRDPSALESVPNAKETQLDKMTNSNINLLRLYGSMEHSERTKVFKKFAESKHGFLLTTDVCSRGLDLTSVNWVVQFNPPSNPVDYIHRAGRTARAGCTGKSVLFLIPEEADYIKHLQKHLGGIKLNKLTPSSIFEKALVHSKKLFDNNPSQRKSKYTVQESLYLTRQVIMDKIKADEILQNLGKLAFQSLVRSYASIDKDSKVYLNHKQLNLGHLASSLALSFKPSEMASARTFDSHKDKIKTNIDKRRRIEKVFSKRAAPGKANGAPKSKKAKKLDQGERYMLSEFGV